MPPPSSGGVALIERAYRGPETAGSWMSEAHLLKGPRTSHADISTLVAQPDSLVTVHLADGSDVPARVMEHHAHFDPEGVRLRG